jgi:multidrug resistance efflux pump
MDGPIASAVVLPEELSVPVSPVNAQKRRQESISEDSAKRPRLSEDGTSNDRRNSISDKRTGPVRREKGRERRLFGAILGALSQNPATTAQKRRSEIEKRQQAQRKHDDHEDEQRKAERAAKRKEQRWKSFEQEMVRLPSTGYVLP